MALSTFDFFSSDPLIFFIISCMGLRTRLIITPQVVVCFFFVVVVGGGVFCNYASNVLLTYE
jgi:hypothetical protein